jgi:hypothetical protein
MKEWNPKAFHAYCLQISENTEDKALKLLRGQVVRRLYEAIDAASKKIAPELGEPLDILRALEAASVGRWGVPTEILSALDEEQREKLFPYISRLVAACVEEGTGLRFSSVPKFVAKPMVIAMNEQIRERMELPPDSEKAAKL